MVINWRTYYAANAGDVERDATRMDATAAYADMTDRAPRDPCELAARIITEVDLVNQINFYLNCWYGSKILRKIKLARARYYLHLILRVIDRVGRRPVSRPDLNDAMPF